MWSQSWFRDIRKITLKILFGNHAAGILLSEPCRGISLVGGCGAFDFGIPDNVKLKLGPPYETLKFNPPKFRPFRMVSAGFWPAGKKKNLRFQTLDALHGKD